MWAQYVPKITACGCGLAVVLFSGCGTASAPPADPRPHIASVEDASEPGDHRTGAVRLLAHDELKHQRAARIEELIAGRVAGVYVSRVSNGDFSIRIRGVNSFMGSGEPLFVVDGMVIPESGRGAALTGLNPHDVERIEVLKDTGSTAFYGVRGANGVILITTKRR